MFSFFLSASSYSENVPESNNNSENTTTFNTENAFLCAFLTCPFVLFYSGKQPHAQRLNDAFSYLFAEIQKQKKNLPDQVEKIRNEITGLLQSISKEDFTEVMKFIAVLAKKRIEAEEKTALPTMGGVAHQIMQSWQKLEGYLEGDLKQFYQDLLNKLSLVLLDFASSEQMNEFSQGISKVEKKIKHIEEIREKRAEEEQEKLKKLEKEIQEKMDLFEKTVEDQKASTSEAIVKLSGTADSLQKDFHSLANKQSSQENLSNQQNQAQNTLLQEILHLKESLHQAELNLNAIKAESECKIQEIQQDILNKVYTKVLSQFTDQNQKFYETISQKSDLLEKEMTELKMQKEQEHNFKKILTEVFANRNNEEISDFLRSLRQTLHDLPKAVKAEGEMFQETLENFKNLVAKEGKEDSLNIECMKTTLEQLSSQQESISGFLIAIEKFLIANKLSGEGEKAEIVASLVGSFQNAMEKRISHLNQEIAKVNENFNANLMPLLKNLLLRSAPTLEKDISEATKMEIAKLDLLSQERFRVLLEKFIVSFGDKKGPNDFDFRNVQKLLEVLNTISQAVYHVADSITPPQNTQIVPVNSQIGTKVGPWTAMERTLLRKLREMISNQKSSPIVGAGVYVLQFIGAPGIGKTTAMKYVTQLVGASGVFLSASDWRFSPENTLEKIFREALLRDKRCSAIILICDEPYYLADKATLSAQSGAFLKAPNQIACYWHRKNEDEMIFEDEFQRLSPDERLQYELEYKPVIFLCGANSVLFPPENPGDSRSIKFFALYNARNFRNEMLSLSGEASLSKASGWVKEVLGKMLLSYIKITKVATIAEMKEFCAAMFFLLNEETRALGNRSSLYGKQYTMQIFSEGMKDFKQFSAEFFNSIVISSTTKPSEIEKEKERIITEMYNIMAEGFSNNQMSVKKLREMFNLENLKSENRKEKNDIRRKISFIALNSSINEKENLGDQIFSQMIAKISQIREKKDFLLPYEESIKATFLTLNYSPPRDLRTIQNAKNYVNSLFEFTIGPQLQKLHKGEVEINSETLAADLIGIQTSADEQLTQTFIEKYKQNSFLSYEDCYEKALMAYLNLPEVILSKEEVFVSLAFYIGNCVEIYVLLRELYLNCIKLRRPCEDIGDRMREMEKEIKIYISQIQLPDSQGNLVDDLMLEDIRSMTITLGNYARELAQDRQEFSEILQKFCSSLETFRINRRHNGPFIRQINLDIPSSSPVSSPKRSKTPIKDGNISPTKKGSQTPSSFARKQLERRTPSFGESEKKLPQFGDHEGEN